jgi:hypothetical protein
MNTDVYVWKCVSEVFLEREMLQTESVEKTKTRILC